MCIAVVETEWIRGVRYLQHSMLERREPWKQFLCALQRFAAEISTANSGVEIVLKGSRISYPRLRAGIPTIEESGGYAIQSAEIQGCRCSSQPLLNFNSRFDANAPVRSCRCWHLIANARRTIVKRTKSENQAQDAQSSDVVNSRLISQLLNCTGSSRKLLVSSRTCKENLIFTTRSSLRFVGCVPK